MKVILATVTISLALPGLDLSTTTFAQGSGAAGGARGGATVGGSVGTARGSSIATGAIGSPTGRIAPVGVTAGQSVVQPGASVATPGAGQIATPGTATPIGPINPGGISATPPQTVGRTFERATIGGGPTDTIIDPAATQPTFRFPPASTLRQPFFTNGGVGGPFDSGLPASSSVAGNPVSVGNVPVTVGNTVGGNFSSVPVRVPPEPVAINLPPGTRITTNAFGAAVLGTPPVQAVTPTIIPTNSVGRGPTFESSTARSSGVTREPIRPTAPPRSAPIVPNR
jgi:hypothetical protein